MCVRRAACRALEVRGCSERVLVIAPSFAGRVPGSLFLALVTHSSELHVRAQAPPLSRASQAEDVTASGVAFVELETSRDTYLVGEVFRLRLRFGFESECLRTALVQLFPRPLDVPAQVFAPALELLEGAQFLDSGDPPAGPSSALTFALDERIARATRGADEERGGRTYAVFEYERAIVATRPGQLALPAPLVGFAHATRFAEDFVLGSTPLDRRDVLVRGREARLTILPLPEEGRPPEFTGAVGAFAIRAVAEPRELEAGQSLKLTAVIEGQGDLSRCEPPHLADLDGFHLQGNLVERGAERLAVTFDLAPRDASVRAVPAIRFAYFDTTPPAGYRTLESRPIPIVVHSATARVPAAGAPEPIADGAGSTRLLVRGLLLLVVLTSLLLWRRARRQH